MSLYRHALPQLADRPFITDGGLETTLVYHEGIDLPHFAAFVLFDRPEGAPILAQYFARYAEIGRANNVGVVLESATWRANPDWGHKLGYNDNALMINCAHPTHFSDVLRGADGWTGRLRGLRANASKRSHAELDVATELDIGDPVALGLEYRELQRLQPSLTVLGGCCGTDHRHVAAICEATRRAGANG